jgi:putative addiction module CopG family antidote
MPRSVILDDELADLIEAQVSCGHYASPSEMVAAGLRTLFEREEALLGHSPGDLRRLVEEGRASGISEEDPEAFFDRLEARFVAPEVWQKAE